MTALPLQTPATEDRELVLRELRDALLLLARAKPDEWAECVLPTGWKLAVKAKADGRVGYRFTAFPHPSLSWDAFLAESYRLTVLLDGRGWKLVETSRRWWQVATFAAPSAVPSVTRGDAHESPR